MTLDNPSQSLIMHGLLGYHSSCREAQASERLKTKALISFELPNPAFSGPNLDNLAIDWAECCSTAPDLFSSLALDP